MQQKVPLEVFTDYTETVRNFNVKFYEFLSVSVYIYMPNRID